MKDPNLFEDLVAVSPGMEIWWDSSPVIFGNWCEKMLAKADDADKASLKGQFARMYNLDDPMSQLFRGVTTNPPLSLAAFKDDPPRWEKVAQKVLAENQGLDTEGLFWVLYKEVVKAGLGHVPPAVRGVRLQGGLPLRPGRPAQRVRRRGHAEAGARDPRREPQRDGQGAGHRPGLPGHRGTHLARHRHQQHAHLRPFAALDCAKSVMRGLEKAKANGVDLSKWRSVITHMEARYGDLGGLREFGAEVGIEVSEADVRYAELAIFKKAYRTLKERNYQSKMLSCSLRLGPTVDGEQRIWHLEEKAGASIVVTCPPTLVDEIIDFPGAANIKFKPNQMT